MEGFRFWTEIAVRFAETDAQGVAHNAAYLVWFEVARIEYLARFRGGYKGIQADGYEALSTESVSSRRACRPGWPTRSRGPKAPSRSGRPAPSGSCRSGPSAPARSADT